MEIIDIFEECPKNRTDGWDRVSDSDRGNRRNEWESGG